ncbi:Carboxysome shell and ethanolamine utilization microcompartment protein CcmL/EutN [Acetoanaerobium noterae]|uniref:Carboxysome shell and ethanolamine utilization microcompartment protein CcmL/EutN n=1 Tax=Acetoanaerobium noterae TaxID=745369 RepID=A0A1T5AVE1_9FIRM|nr:BMC domain-containing protein [Acetoanaerobium noterae]SKB38777.1 Carboxysome shell and ethanolamine utilization microcompartment protein CcmL/EutN [Acetoanaerobium noterae]
MKNKALGLIETYGYIGAIEAADTAVKAAYVELSAVEKVKGGLVTVQLLGDVGAVKAAVDAGVQKCKALGVYVSSHVIARPDSELYKIVPKLNSEETDKPKEIIAFEDENAKEDEKIEKADKIEKDEKADKLETSEPEFKLPKHFYTMKVVLLRNYVRKLDNFPIPNKKIKFANKQQLIDGLIEYYKTKPMTKE